MIGGGGAENKGGVRASGVYQLPSPSPASAFDESKSRTARNLTRGVRLCIGCEIDA
jgi:hypothetical protein